MRLARLFGTEISSFLLIVISRELHDICLQANKRKQAASTNQKRLDLFTPGVVASFGHLENLQNLTYYQSIQMEKRMRLIMGIRLKMRM